MRLSSFPFSSVTASITASMLPSKFIVERMVKSRINSSATSCASVTLVKDRSRFTFTGNTTGSERFPRY